MALKKIKKVLLQYWGYDGFLPLQQEAMETVTAGRDAVVILPTGGGKSLCFQVPAVLFPGVTVVVSPLISLMKDQVDSLQESGIYAERLDSTLPFDQQKEIVSSLLRGELKLLYISPERLLTAGFIDILKKAHVSFFAIDEAHCVSMWGHDFRPEYRQLSKLRKLFPKAVFAAYTATATEHVQNDIAQQLHLKDPNMLVGSFDRPNLIYKVRPKRDIIKQVLKVINQFHRQSGVIYCIRRKDVESMAAELRSLGYKALPYHAGMDDNERRKNQDKFIREKVDIIVATVAFGMGIDKSNVRYVIHAGMPKSLEHYQQESGRAGRDRLEAECWLFYSPGDYGTWKSFTRDMNEASAKIAMEKLSAMYNFCTSGTCRHKTILNYFGQEPEKDNCQCCDVCLGQLETISDPLVTGQKILSCVARLEQRYGGSYTAAVLTGSRESRILECGHDNLSTYGLLNDFPKNVVQDWIEQLCGQGYLTKAGEYNVLHITPKGLELLRGNETPRLLKPAIKAGSKSRIAEDSWKNVDKALFEKLKDYRTEKATERGLPAYIIFGDSALRDMARLKPTSNEALLEVKGIGEKKSKQYGKEILNIISGHKQ